VARIDQHARCHYKLSSRASRAEPGAAIYGHAAIGGALGAPVSCGEVGKPEALKGFMANLFRDEGGEAVTRPGKSGRNGIFRVCKAGKARLHGLRKGTQKRFWQDHPMGDIAPGLKCDPASADPSDAHAITAPWGSEERDIERLIIPASTCQAR
jgi:hypothetical protein